MVNRKPGWCWREIDPAGGCPARGREGVVRGTSARRVSGLGRVMGACGVWFQGADGAAVGAGCGGLQPHLTQTVAHKQVLRVLIVSTKP